MNKQFVCTANSGVSNIATNAIIPLGTVVRQQVDCCGNSCKLDGTGIICKGHNAAFKLYGFVVLEQVSTSSPTAPIVSVAVSQNGSVSELSESSAASSGRVSLPICWVVRNDGTASSVVTIVNTGVPVNLVDVVLNAELM